LCHCSWHSSTMGYIQTYWVKYWFHHQLCCWYYNYKYVRKTIHYDRVVSYIDRKQYIMTEWRVISTANNTIFCHYGTNDKSFQKHDWMNISDHQRNSSTNGRRWDWNGSKKHQVLCGKPYLLHVHFRHVIIRIE